MKISIEDKIDEFMSKNKRRDVKKLVKESLNGSVAVPRGYTEQMFNELRDVGMNIIPTNLQDARFQELELTRGGSAVKDLINGLTKMTEADNLARFESMKRMQNPLLFGKFKWIFLTFLLFSIVGLLLIFI